MHVKKIVLLIVFCVLVACHSFYLPLIKHLLVYQTTLPQQVDAVVVLSGNQTQRVDRAVEILQYTQSQFLIFTGAPFYNISEPQLMRTYALSLSNSLPPILLEENSYSTKDHALELLPIFQQHNISSVLVVTSGFHTRRSYITLQRYFKNQNYPINLYITAADDSINYANWWRQHEMIERVSLETQKSIFYFFFVFN